MDSCRIEWYGDICGSITRAALVQKHRSGQGNCRTLRVKELGRTTSVGIQECPAEICANFLSP